MKEPTDNRKCIIPQARKETMAAEIHVNRYKAHILLDPCTQGRDLLSNNFCTLFKLPLTEMEKKPLETAIQGSKSPVINKTTVLMNLPGYEAERSYYVTNLRNWDGISEELALKKLKAIINVHDHMIYIQPAGMSRYDIIM
jgi:hypothetical protein